MGCSLNFVIECWHGFNPFAKIINGHNDVLMDARRSGISFHKIDGPFAEWTDDDEEMEWCRKIPFIGGNELVVVEVLDGHNAIGE